MVLGAIGSFVASWLRKLAVLLFVFSFLASGVVLNIVQFFFLPLYWLNRRLYRIINAKIVYFHWASELMRYCFVLSYKRFLFSS